MSGFTSRLWIWIYAKTVSCGLKFHIDTCPCLLLWPHPNLSLCTFLLPGWLQGARFGCGFCFVGSTWKRHCRYKFVLLINSERARKFLLTLLRFGFGEKNCFICISDEAVDGFWSAWLNICFFACEVWCLADISSISPLPEKTERLWENLGCGEEVYRP